MEDLQLTTTMEAMRKQEYYYYGDACGDYLLRARGISTDNYSKSNKVKVNVDHGNREAMAEWSYKVVEYLGFSAETVEISMNYFDRYLSTPVGSTSLACAKQFQLANMVCLYLSIKLHEEVILDSKFMSNLSNGLFSYDQVEAMELHILHVLQWWVTPPTSQAFLREYMHLLPAAVSDDTKEKTMALCELQVKASVLDYNFVSARASTVALCAVVNALKILGMDNVLLGHIASLLSYASCVDLEDISEGLQQTLYETILVDIPHLCTGGEIAVSETAKTGIICKDGVSTHDELDGNDDRAMMTGSPCGVFL